MTRKEAREAIKEAYGSSEYTDEIIKALEQEPCGKDINVPATDCISRQPKTEVLDKIRAEIADLDDADYDYEGYYKAVTDALKIIDKYKAESEDKE